MSSEQALIRTAGKWARVGERSFWHWLRTLSAAERRIVDRWMIEPDTSPAPAAEEAADRE